ncbi:immunoglobulin superfamily member 1-like [Bufo gargarizans]|uniref:immunoglobulin superfamily member 1-like n=1 Tax=Bufo gargarizans TaxID=30331 RepID=UPI001CF2BE1E|nr:immunoglobulin superfamily member 1-like [Bufo gargarizans]
MNTMIILIFATIWCLLDNKQWASASALQKPILQLVAEDPQKNVMKGDNITLSCITGSGSIFYLVHEKSNGKNETREDSHGKFSFMNIQIEQDGDYSCKYCNDHRKCSELSSPLNIYVRDTFPRPDINISPQRVVQPGATITITCSTHYSNVEFSLLKNNVIVKNSSSGNQLSYVISNAKNSDMGYYSCIYKSGTSGMRSMRSNPMKISVLALPAPLMTWEEAPSDSSKLRINCRAPDNLEYNEFFFTLLDGRKVIEEITAIGINVTFVVTKPKYTTKEYCMYRVKVDYDYADSLQSFVQLESNRSWMLIRHILSALILMLIGIILLLHFKDFGNKHEKQPDLPPNRVKYKRGTEVVWSSDDE